MGEGEEQAMTRTGLACHVPEAMPQPAPHGLLACLHAAGQCEGSTGGAG